MRTVQILIDEAANLCRTDAELARRLGKTRSQIADMRSGRDPVSPETVALLCDLVQLPGEEARRLAAIAIVEAPRNAARKEALRRAFFVSWVDGALALLPCGNASATQGSNSRQLSTVDSLYIVRSLCAASVRVMCAWTWKAIRGFRLRRTLCRAAP